MTFEQALEQALDVLRRRGRTSLRALRRQLGVDEEFLEDLRHELVEVLGAATEEPGGVLAATGAAAGAEPAEAPPPVPTPGRPARAERRQLTVMFCDLIDSTGLSERLDPEDFRELLQLYQACAGAQVERYDGHVAQYLGDGILVYFGYPHAHEDDARRAVLAGLGLIAALEEPDAALQARFGVRMRVRIGVHTGVVVVGEVGTGSHREQLALGETPNVAARLQGLAGPDRIVVSAATRRLLGEGFVVEDLGPQRVKGIAEPVVVHRVVGLSRAGAGAAPRGRALVGRQAELARMHRSWEAARQGSGEVLLLAGEAGIGKSRLVRALRDRVAETGGVELVLRCSPYNVNSALYPVLERLAERVDLAREDPPAERLRKLEAELGRVGLPLDEAVPLLAPLFSIPLDARHAAPVLGPERARARTRTLLLDWILGAADGQPLLVVFEDLHWADPSTLELLEHLGRRASTSRALLLATYRPEFEPRWPADVPTAQVPLRRLDRAAIEALLERLSGGRRLPAELVEQIVTKTDGVPLFVEEVTKLLLDSDLLVAGDGVWELSGPLPHLAVPTTLQDSLMARLDRLSEARELAQLGAVIGREFSHELIAAVSPLKGPALERALDQLVAAELLFRAGEGTDRRYVFKHALIQDVAYESLLKATRLGFHSRIAAVYEQRFPELVEATPERLARHLALAGEPARAVPYWQRAGEVAFARSAHTEAIGHFESALGALVALAGTPERDALEIRLQNRLGAPLTATRGYGAPEVEAAYARALELAEEHGSTDDLFQAMYGLWRVNMLRAEYARSVGFAERLLEIAERERSPSLLVPAHRGRGAVRFYQGRLAECLADMRRVGELALELGADATRPMNDVYDVVDPRATCGSYAAWALSLQGRHDEAAAASREALRLAEELDHPFSRALVLSFATWLQQFRGDVEGALELAQRAVSYSEEQGFPFWLGWGGVLRGWALGHLGDPDGGAAAIRAGLALWREKGSELGRSYFYALLAEVELRREDPDAALLALASARRFADRTGERYWEPERLRLEAGILDARGDRAAARALLDRALAVARSQGAAALEQRVARDLARA